MGVIHSVQEAVLEVQGYVDETASTLERIKKWATPSRQSITKEFTSMSSSLFNFTVPWLSVLAIVVLTIVSVVLYHIPLRYLVLAFIINKFTKRFRKPKDYIDNNELADFISRLPSDPELVRICSFSFSADEPSLSRLSSSCSTEKRRFSPASHHRKKSNVEHHSQTTVTWTMVFVR
jgi:hypothetical protein